MILSITYVIVFSRSTLVYPGWSIPAMLLLRNTANLAAAARRLNSVRGSSFTTSSRVGSIVTNAEGDNKAAAALATDGTSRGRTAGEMGDEAAQSMHDFMKGAEGAALDAGGRLEPRWVSGPAGPCLGGSAVGWLLHCAGPGERRLMHKCCTVLRLRRRQSLHRPACRRGASCMACSAV